MGGGTIVTGSGVLLDYKNPPPDGDGDNYHLKEVGLIASGVGMIVSTIGVILVICGGDTERSVVVEE